MKLKRGPCKECKPGTPDKVLCAGLCPTHYRRRQQQRAYEKQQNKEPKPRSPIRQTSDTEAARLRKYYPIARAFKEAHPECEIKVAGCQYWTTEVHHSKGRDGELLFDTRFFVAGCHNCHSWAELHPTAAKAMGVSRDRLTKEQIICK